jgi:hypothetical protein
MAGTEGALIVLLGPVWEGGAAVPTVPPWLDEVSTAISTGTEVIGLLLGATATFPSGK